MKNLLFVHDASSPLLLGLLGLGGAALFCFVHALRAPRSAEAAAPSALERPADPAAAAGLVAAQREPLPAAPALAAPPDAARPAPADAARPLGARGEKQFLAEFSELSTAALEARAAEVLDGDGPQAQKVALLRALRAGGSAQSLAWHEHAVRTGADASGPQGVGLASTALGALMREAELDEAVCATLARLAFEAPELAPELRRRAASGFARHCDEDGLARLAVELARSTDELLVAGALAALDEREPSAARTRLLLAHGRSEEPHAPAQE